jgi:S-adenosylmethionine hydrolase
MPVKKKNPKKKSHSGKKHVPLIALISDFGQTDQYAGAVKGVILSINPDAKIVDITHDVGPQKIRQAGYLLWSVYRYFPEGTIFICIVDPGVGSKRNIVCLKTGSHTFIAPDNGLLNFVLSGEKFVRVFEINEKKAAKYLPGSVSSTFHGRDIMAPIAAHISKGVRPDRIGSAVATGEILPQFVHSKVSAVPPGILHIDHFGNVITNLELSKNYAETGDVQAVSLDRHLVSRWIQFYDEAPDNTPCLIEGSSGLLEITVRNGNAARLLNVSLDSQIKVYWR